MIFAEVGQRMLKRYSLAAAAIGILALAAPSFAASNTSLETVIKKVQQQQKNTNTLQADFKQEKELALMSKPEVSTGQFVYSKPNNVLWTYDSPKRVQMVIAGGVLTTYYQDLGKAERIDVKRFEDRIFKYMGASGAIDELARYFDFTFTDSKSKPTFLLDLPAIRPPSRRDIAADESGRPQTTLPPLGRLPDGPMGWRCAGWGANGPRVVREG